MANDTNPAGTSRPARVPREHERPPTEGDADTRGQIGSRRKPRGRRTGLRRAGCRLLVGAVVIVGVALTVTTDFLQYRAIAGSDVVRHAVAGVMPAGSADRAK